MINRNSGMYALNKVKGMRLKMKKNNIKNIIMNIIIIIMITLSFWIIDFGIRYLSYKSFKFYSYKQIIPSLFTFGWSSIFIGVFYLIKQKKRQIFYLISLIIANLIILSQYLHFIILQRFYGINDIFLAKEGSYYIGFALLKIDIKILSIIFLSLLFGIISINLSKKYHETYRDKPYFIFTTIISIFIALICFGCARISFGNNIEENYKASVNDLAAYKDFTNPTKNIQVAGLYETIPRSIVFYIKDKINDNTKKRIEEINNYIDNNQKTITPNEYTGIFKDKNLIVIHMESVDTFFINEEAMPTLHTLANEGLNFTNRYAPIFGGGATINSEYALNTGLYSSQEGNSYNYNNTYKTSLANIFKNNGYNTNSIHFNSGFYYNRKELHQNLGYNNHYALLDMDNMDNDKYKYQYDSNLMKNEKVVDLIIPDNKFLTFITTYSAHLPYDYTNSLCQHNNYRVRFNGDNELSCIYNLAYDTDEMIRLLLEKLKNKNILNNTVIVLASDHHAYSYSKINDVKNTDNNYLLLHTPLIIWSTDIEAKNIDIPVDTTDILPTIYNLFGISYNPNLYVGEDIFSTTRNNYIYFNEDVYYKDNTLYDISTNPGETSIYKEIKETIKFNNNLIESNYLKIKN